MLFTMLLALAKRLIYTAYLPHSATDTSPWLLKYQIQFERPKCFPRGALSPVADDNELRDCHFLLESPPSGMMQQKELRETCMDLGTRLASIDPVSIHGRD